MNNVEKAKMINSIKEKKSAKIEDYDQSSLLKKTRQFKQRPVLDGKRPDKDKTLNILSRIFS